MSVFGAYSSYYSLLYREKDYAGEASYVGSLIKKHLAGAKNILDLGCGTGKHDILLDQMNYNVTGVDRSEKMLAIANSQSSGVDFIQGDIRTVRLDKAFDVVISLFHVMSYQTTNDDVLKSLATIKEHLNPGGIFIFDCWYGPAVLSEQPATRIKRLEDESVLITRLAEPVLHPNENLVDVNYHLFIRDKANGEVEELRETHSMRYFFAPEVALLCNASGLRINDFYEFLSFQRPSLNSWNTIFVGIKD